MCCSSVINGPLGTGSPTLSLSAGNHVLTASIERLKRTANVRLHTDL
ncbi:MAG: hypothetical protein M3319_01480 [Actinomycetota bacterium]|nr:hypothetical protein [Actinomycetota bacterium]